MKEEILKTWQTYKKALPILFGMLVLINLLEPWLADFYGAVFTGNYFLDPLIGSVLGSVSAGMPITAYILSGELLKQGVTLLAVSAFALTWTTVHLAFLPMEASFLGKRFGIVRNSVNFVFAIIISILVVYLTGVING